MTETHSIKWLRVNAGLTQQQAAATIGVSRVTFNRWENGQTPVPPLKLARFQKVLASNAAFAPPIPDTPPAGPSKVTLRAEYDKMRAVYDADTRGELPEDEYEKYFDARDAWYQAEYGAKALITRYEEEVTSVLDAGHRRPDPGNWLQGEVHHAETPAYRAFVKAYGLDLQ